MTTATIHERVCALMRDGHPRFLEEVIREVGSNENGVRPVLTRLEIDETLNVVRDPESCRRMFVWNNA